MTDVLKPQFTTKAGGFDFIFRVPTPLDKARLGTREASIRRALDPAGSGYPDGYDMDTFYLIRGMAVMELFLEKSDAKWAFAETKAEKGVPAGVRVDIAAFPSGTEEVITEVGRRFQADLDKFHGRGDAAGQPPADEVVEGSESSGPLRPVASEPAG